MTRGSMTPAAGPGAAMRFSVDGWDPSYGASFEVDGELGESTARVDTDIELPAARWRPVDPETTGEVPEALLFVDGVRRVEAQVWIDSDSPLVDQASGEISPGEPTAALCASYAAGVVCCCKAGAHLVSSKRQRGLFSVAAHARDIDTRAGGYRAHHVTVKQGKPVMPALSQALQGRLALIEEDVANAARDATAVGQAVSAGHPLGTDGDLLILDGNLRGRQHLPRALGYIKSHHTTYLPPELNAVVGRLAPGQRTPVFEVGTRWDRRSWYLRLPCPPAAPWAGIVRVECSVSVPLDEAVRLAGLSQRCLGRFASAAYKDTRAPQNLYPIAGLERELRRRLGDPALLYRALREASRP